MIGIQYPPASLQTSVAPKLQASETTPSNEGILDIATKMQCPRRSVGWSGSILRQRSQDDAARTGLASRGVWREMVSGRGVFPLERSRFHDTGLPETGRDLPLNRRGSMPPRLRVPVGSDQGFCQQVIQQVYPGG
jgi:hypothetical protein